MKRKQRSCSAVRLICTFVFTYAKSRFSHDAALIQIHKISIHIQGIPYILFGFNEFCKIKPQITIDQAIHCLHCKRLTKNKNSPQKP